MRDFATVNIRKHLLARLKLEAVAQDRTVAYLVNRAVEAYLQAEASQGESA